MNKDILIAHVSDGMNNIIKKEVLSISVWIANKCNHSVNDESVSALIEEAEKILQKRKRQIQNKLDIFKKNIDDIKALTNKNSSISIFNEILESIGSNSQAIKEKDERKIATLPQMEQQYDHLLSNFNSGNINYLLNILGIEKIENPVSFKLDNQDDMRALKNAFGAQAINEANGDVNLMYARLKVEQNYNL